MRLEKLVLFLLLAYASASLFHHVHNAEFLAFYPNMPGWITRMHVYAAWAAVTVVGVLGLLIYRFVHQLAGLLVIAAYAAFGFDGLGHYGLAPCSAHTSVMNLSIGMEVATGALLLAATAWRASTWLRTR